MIVEELKKYIVEEFLYRENKGAESTTLKRYKFLDDGRIEWVYKSFIGGFGRTNEITINGIDLEEIENWYQKYYKNKIREKKLKRIT